MANQSVLKGISARQLFEKEIGLTASSVEILFNFILPKILIRTNTTDNIKAKYYDIIEELYINDVLGVDSSKLDNFKSTRGTNVNMNSKFKGSNEIFDAFINILMYYTVTTLTDAKYKAVFKNPRTSINATLTRAGKSDTFTYAKPPDITTATDIDLLSFLEYILIVFLSARSGGEPANASIREEWKTISDYLELVSTGRVTKKKIQDKSDFINNLKFELGKEQFIPFIEATPNILLGNSKVSSIFSKIPKLQTDLNSVINNIKTAGANVSLRIEFPKFAEAVWNIFYEVAKADTSLPDEPDRKNFANISVEDLFDSITEKLKSKTEAIETRSDYVKSLRFDLEKEKYTNFINAVRTSIPVLTALNNVDKNIVKSLEAYVDEKTGKALTDDPRLSYIKIGEYVWDIYSSIAKADTSITSDNERSQLTRINADNYFQQMLEAVKTATFKVAVSSRFDSKEQFITFLNSKTLSKYIDANTRKRLISDLKIKAVDSVFEEVVALMTTSVTKSLEASSAKFKTLPEKEKTNKISEEVNTVVKTAFLEVGTPNKWKDLSKSILSKFATGILKGSLALTLIGLGRTRTQAAETAGKIVGGGKSILSNISKFIKTPTGKLSSSALDKLNKKTK